MPDLSSKMADSDLIPEGKIRFEDCHLSGTILNSIFYTQHNLELPVPEREREITIVLLLI